MRVKVHVTKKSFTGGGNPTKIFNFLMTSHFKVNPYTGIEFVYMKEDLYARTFLCNMYPQRLRLPDLGLLRV